MKITKYTLIQSVAVKNLKQSLILKYKFSYTNFKTTLPEPGVKLWALDLSHLKFFELYKSFQDKTKSLNFRPKTEYN